MAMIKGCSMSLFAASLFNLDVVRLNGQGQAVPKGFQANLPANQHPPSIPGLEFTGGDILPFH